AVELWAAEERLALGLDMVGKLAHEIDAAHVLEGHGLVRAVGCQHVEGFAFTECRGVEIASKGSAVSKLDDYLLMGRGWGAVLHKASPARYCQAFETML